VIEYRCLGSERFMNSYYTVITFLTVFTLAIVQISVKESNTLTKARKKSFILLYNAILLAAFFEWLGNYLQGAGPSTYWIHVLVKCLELSIAPSIAFIVSFVIEKKNTEIIYIFLAIHAGLEILSAFFGFVYHVDANSYYTHASFYWIYVLVYLISLVYCVFVTAQNVGKYQYKGIRFFALIIIMMLLGVGIQLFDSTLKVSYITLSIGSLMLYVFTLEMVNQTDELTELLNRRGYENYLNAREDACVIIFFDVDDFKFINDTYGHAFGDVCLRSIGKQIKHTYAKNGLCFRYGGDEFCVILSKKIDSVFSLNDQFKENLNLIRQKEDRIPTVSIGYAFFDPNLQSIQDVVEEADQMMYQAKTEKKRLH
jgi:diguanylate cyclase (GGDEF)-like protein